MEETQDIKGLPNVEVSGNGICKPAAEGRQKAGATLIPHPSDDPLDPLVSSQ
jgi:hypothetical protein